MDLIFFCGPVILRPAFSQIDWKGRDVRIIVVEGDGSDYFSNLAEQLRDASGRILPNLLATYAKGIDPSRVDKIAFGAYSAGHGLVNKVLDVDADRARVTAVILNDATFSGFTDPPKPGYVKFGLEAAVGNKLFVSTTANTTSGAYLSGRDSWLLVWNAIHAQSGNHEWNVNPRTPVPPASGGWWRMGECYWGNYSPPGVAPNTLNDFTHAQQHDLAPACWQAYLAPWLAGETSWLLVIAGIAVVGTGAWLLLTPA